VRLAVHGWHVDVDVDDGVGQGVGSVGGESRSGSRQPGLEVAADLVEPAQQVIDPPADVPSG
jgi:hypothetical protein